MLLGENNKNLKDIPEKAAVADIRQHINYILEQLHNLEHKVNTNAKVKKDAIVTSNENKDKVKKDATVTSNENNDKTKKDATETPNHNHGNRCKDKEKDCNQGKM